MSARRYRFGPLEERGLVGPLSARQVAVVGFAALLALVAMYAMRSWSGMLVAVALLAGGGAAIYVPLSGHTIEEWAPIALRWVARSADQKRGYRSGSPTAGARVAASGELICEGSLPPAMADLAMLEAPYGGDSVGVLYDPKRGTYTAALAVRAGAFGLLDGSEQERKLDAWGSVLASLARDGSPVCRLQWIERTLPGRGDEHAAYFQAERDRSVPLDSGLVSSYIELIETAAPASQEHEILLALQIDERRGGRDLRRLGGGAQAGCELVLREAENLAEHLSIAEVVVHGLMRPNRFGEAIRNAFDPYGRAGRGRAAIGGAGEGVDPARMGPQADHESWSSYRTDSAEHVTAWVSSWPRTDVGPAFLTPLLMQTTALRTVSVCIEPVPHSAAVRRAEAERTAEIAEEMQRERQGFMTSARVRRRQESAARREEELADGHAEMRLAGYVGAHGRDKEEAERFFAEVEHCAALARLELERLYGEQEAAFYNLLPLGWGLQ